MLGPRRLRRGRVPCPDRHRRAEGLPLGSVCSSMKWGQRCSVGGRRAQDGWGTAARSVKDWGFRGPTTPPKWGQPREGAGWELYGGGPSHQEITPPPPAAKISPRSHKCRWLPPGGPHPPPSPPLATENLGAELEEEHSTGKPRQGVMEAPRALSTAVGQLERCPREFLPFSILASLSFRYREDRGEWEEVEGEYSSSIPSGSNDQLEPKTRAPESPEMRVTARDWDPRADAPLWASACPPAKWTCLLQASSQL